MTEHPEPTPEQALRDRVAAALPEAVRNARRRDAQKEAQVQHIKYKKRTKQI